ncbi:M48 family metalloprotease, partial [Bacillus thuringiensis]|nr:M48 family metalloprotease [Bacillus thuringiensis]
CHVLNNHLIKNVMSLAFALAGVPLLLLIVSPLLFKINVLWIALSIIIVIYVGLIILHFMFSQRREYIADQYATNIVGNEISLSTLKVLKDN